MNSSPLLSRLFDQFREPLELFTGELLVADERRHSLLDGAVEERLHEPFERRAPCPIARDGWDEHVAETLLLVTQEPLLFEDAQQRAHGRVARWIGNGVGHFGRG